MTDMAWREGMADWQPIRSLKDIAMSTPTTPIQTEYQTIRQTPASDPARPPSISLPAMIFKVIVGWLAIMVGIAFILIGIFLFLAAVFDSHGSTHPQLENVVWCIIGVMSFCGGLVVFEFGRNFRKAAV